MEHTSTIKENFVKTLKKAYHLLNIKANNLNLSNETLSLIKDIIETLTLIKNDPNNIEAYLKNEIIKSLYLDIKENRENKFYTKLIEYYPESLLELLEIPNITYKTIYILKHELGITSLFDLLGFLNCSPQKICDLPISLSAIEGMHKYAQIKQNEFKGTFLITEGKYYENLIKNFIKNYLGSSYHIHTVGDLRRGKSLIKNLEFILTSKDLKLPLENTFLIDLSEAIYNYLGQLKNSSNNLTTFQDNFKQNLNEITYKINSDTIEFILPSKLPLKIYFCEYISLPQELIKLTSSDKHWDIIKGLIVNKEFTIRAFDTNKIEEDFYNTINLAFIPPEIREGEEEIELAKTDKLSNLIEIKDIKGDLHIHTNWSDGKCTIEQMVQEAIKLGYEYIAITDHSNAVKIVPGLDTEKLLSQIEVIKELNKKYHNFKILCGAEVDIMPDGSLYFDNNILSKLDIVIASIHLESSAAPHVIYRRLLKVIENPYVDIIAHPTGRILHIRDSYNIDWEDIFDRIAAKGKALEINCNPSRLDMPSKFIKLAIKKGIPIVINTDSHKVETLKLMELGVKHARKAYTYKENILNTMDLKNILTWLEEKRKKYC